MVSESSGKVSFFYSISRKHEKADPRTLNRVVVGATMTDNEFSVIKVDDPIVSLMEMSKNRLAILTEKGKICIFNGEENSMEKIVDLGSASAVVSCSLQRQSKIGSKGGSVAIYMQSLRLDGGSNLEIRLFDDEMNLVAESLLVQNVLLENKPYCLDVCHGDGGRTDVLLFNGEAMILLHRTGESDLVTTVLDDIDSVRDIQEIKYVCAHRAILLEKSGALRVYDSKFKSVMAAATLPQKTRQNSALILFENLKKSVLIQDEQIFVISYNVPKSTLASILGRSNAHASSISCQKAIRKKYSSDADDGEYLALLQIKDVHQLDEQVKKLLNKKALSNLTLDFGSSCFDHFVSLLCAQPPQQVQKKGGKKDRKKSAGQNETEILKSLIKLLLSKNLVLNWRCQDSIKKVVDACHWDLMECMIQGISDLKEETLVSMVAKSLNQESVPEAISEESEQFNFM